MPLGSYSLTYHFADQLCKHQPKSVLDLGIGFGLQGALVRQYLDGGVADKQTARGWGTTLIGVEGFPHYHNPVYELYDGFFLCDIRTYLFKEIDHRHCPRTFDFIIFSDVLEHFEKEEGREIVYKLMTLLNLGGVLLIGTPAVWAEQGAVHGNEYETHRSLWAWNEFPPGFEVIKNGEPDEFGHRMILVKYVRK